MPVIATFSILGDLVKNVGGDRVEVGTLVGPNSDSHVYAPTPADAKKVAAAKVVFINGLGFEGWTTRLVKASGTKAPTVTVTKGIKSRKMEEEGHGHGHGVTDPHAWQSIANTKIYVANIRDGLIAADPAGKSVYEDNARTYLAKLDALEAEVKDAIGKIPADRRRIITSHDAFGYFGAAYGIEFISPDRGIDGGGGVRQGRRQDHRADQEAENSGGVYGEHLRSAHDGADRQGERREDRRKPVLRCAIRREGPGADLYRNDAQQYPSARDRAYQLMIG